MIVISEVKLSEVKLHCKEPLLIPRKDVISASVTPYSFHILRKRWLDSKNMDPWSNFGSDEVKKLTKNSNEKLALCVAVK